ncbi:MAG: phenylacetate--CoA ligase family protein, partial [Desulfobacteraceae bacterium]
MIPILARNIFRFQEALLGRPSFRILRELNRTQWWPRERLEALQLERLQRVLQGAYEHTPYWRELMDAQGIRTADIRSLQDLQRFPLLEKQT